MPSAILAPETTNETGAIGRALARARALGRPVLLTSTRLLTNPVDPIAWFANGPSGEPATLWQQPDRGVALVGRGVAAEFTHDGEGAFPELSRRLRQLFADAVRVESAEAPPESPVALAGFAFDPARPDDPAWADFPDAAAVVPASTLRILGDRVLLTAALPVPPNEDAEAVAERLAERFGAVSLPTPFRQADQPPATLLDQVDVLPESDWKSLVASTAATVRGGRLDKVVLAREERLRFDRVLEVSGLLDRLRTANPSATIFAFRRGDSVFAGASPELLLRRMGGVVETTPLAGSIRRGETPEEDDRLGRRLLRSAKDQTEHAVVVGAVLQALDPVCLDLQTAGDGPVVVKQRTVQHLATPVRGRTRGDVTAIDLAGLLHPTPAVGGYPKDPALALIRDREGFDRGWYAGPVGWIDASGDGEFVIAIRSALLRGDTATLFAGCGIVGDSDPEQELAETRLKLRAVGAALGVAER